MHGVSAMRILAFAVFSIFSLNAWAQPVTDRTGLPSGPETDIPYTHCDIASPFYLGGNKLTVFCGSSRFEKPFIEPYLKINWEKLEEARAKVCENKAPSDNASIQVTYELMSPIVIEQVRAELTSRGVYPEHSKGRLFPHPFAAVYLFTGSTGPTSSRDRKDRHVFPPEGLRLMSSGRLANYSQFPMNVRPFRMTDSCEELQAIIGEHDISAEMYFQFVTIARNVIYAHLSRFYGSSQYASIANRQSQTGAVEHYTSGGSKGWGINIGPIGIGDTSTRGTQGQRDTRQRFVSQDLVQRATRDYVDQYSLNQWTEFSKDESIKKDDVATELMKMMLARATSIEADIRRTENGMLKLVYQNYEQTLSPDESKLLMESVPQGAFEFSNEQSGKFGYGEISVEGQEKRQTKVPNMPQMKWQKEGGVWIPTSVTLHAVANVSVSQASSISLEEAKVEFGDGFAVRQLQSIEVDAPTPMLPPPIPKSVYLLQGEAMRALPPAPNPPGVPAGYAFCSDRYTLTARNRGQLGSMVLNDGFPVSSIGSDVGQPVMNIRIYPVHQMAPACFSGQDEPNCVVNYAVCQNPSRSTACAVNQAWLMRFFSMRSPMGPPAMIDEICSAEDRR